MLRITLNIVVLVFCAVVACCHESLGFIETTTSLRFIEDVEGLKLNILTIPKLSISPIPKLSISPIGQAISSPIGFLCGKETVPEYVYRMDARSPAVIAKEGFAPHDKQGRLSIFEHVIGAKTYFQLFFGHSNTAIQKHNSQWVSTTSSLNFFRNDWVFDTIFGSWFWQPTTYLYKIKTSSDKMKYTDVNHHACKKLKLNIFASELEIIHEGKIRPEDIVGFFNPKKLHGSEFKKLVKEAKKAAPKKSLEMINGAVLPSDWKTMPKKKVKKPVVKKPVKKQDKKKQDKKTQDKKKQDKKSKSGKKVVQAGAKKMFNA